MEGGCLKVRREETKMNERREERKKERKKVERERESEGKGETDRHTHTLGERRNKDE